MQFASYYKFYHLDNHSETVSHDYTLIFIAYILAYIWQVLATHETVSHDYTLIFIAYILAYIWQVLATHETVSHDYTWILVHIMYILLLQDSMIDITLSYLMNCMPFTCKNISFTSDSSL